MNVCQSCGMPLGKDPFGGGTNADGSKNEKYCGYCYQNGEFVDSRCECERVLRTMCFIPAE